MIWAPIDIGTINFSLVYDWGPTRSQSFLAWLATIKSSLTPKIIPLLQITIHIMIAERDISHYSFVCGIANEIKSKNWRLLHMDESWLFELPPWLTSHRQYSQFNRYHGVNLVLHI